MRIELPNTISLLLLAVVAAILTAVAAWLPGEYSGAYVGLITLVLASASRAIQVYLDGNKESGDAGMATRSAGAKEVDSPSRMRKWLVG